MQLQRNVASGMSKIETHYASVRMPRARDTFHLECLAGVVVHTSQHDERNRFPLAREIRLDIIRPDERFSLSWLQLNECIFRIKPMKPDLRLRSILVGRKSIGLDDNLVTCGGGPVERDHHEMKIDGEAVHHDNFNRPCTDESRRLPGQQFMIGHPGMLRVEMPFNPKSGPIGELLFHVLLYGFRLESKRMTAEVDGVITIFLFGNVKKRAIFLKRILGVLFDTKGLIVAKGSHWSNPFFIPATLMLCR